MPDNDPKKLRILFILEYYPPHVGGGETLFRDLARGLVGLGHECAVVTARLAGTPAFEMDGGVAVHRVAVPKTGDRHWFTLLALPLCLKLARRADIIHTMTYNAALPAWLAARLRRKPAVILVHEVLGPAWRRLGFPRLLALCYRFAEALVLSLPFDCYAANSRATLRSLSAHGIALSRISLAYPGVDASLFGAPPKVSREKIRRLLDLNGSQPAALYFGRPGPVKGVEILVRAAALVRGIFPDFRLVLILSPDPPSGRARVDALAREAPAGSVTILPPQPRELLPAFAAACEVVAVPSLSEGFGFTTAETCAAGRPVAATRVGAAFEVVSGRFLLVPPENPEALAAGIVKALLGRTEARPPRRFETSSMVAAHVDLYRRRLL